MQIYTSYWRHNDKTHSSYIIKEKDMDSFLDEANNPTTMDSQMDFIFHVYCWWLMDISF